MNMKMIALSSLVAASAVFAQEEAVAEDQNTQAVEETTSEPAVEEQAAEQPAEQPAEAVAEPAVESSSSVVAVEESSSSSEPVAAAPDASNGKFDVLRGNAYNNVGNEAAASTIGSNMAAPYKMYGSKLVYLEPTLDNAVVSFGTNNTYFAGFDNSDNLGLLQLGMATKAFGVELYTAIGKTWKDEDGDDAETSSTTVNTGDVIGAIFSMKLGSLDLTVNGEWRTTDNETSTETTVGDDTVEEEQDYWDAQGTVSVSNSPSGSSIAWTASLTFLRHNLTEMTDDGDEEVDATAFDSHIEIMPQFNIGTKVLEVENARVFVGLNTYIPIMIFDDVEGDNYYYRKDHSGFGIYTAPNILAELAVNDNWLVFGGATYLWNIYSMETLTEDDADFQVMTMETGAVSVNAGARFQYKNVALEAAILDSFYQNPLEGFNGTYFIARIGGFIFF